MDSLDRGQPCFFAETIEAWEKKRSPPLRSRQDIPSSRRPWTNPKVFRSCGAQTFFGTIGYRDAAPLELPPDFDSINW
jgi:hypothetical protein